MKLPAVFGILSTKSSTSMSPSEVLKVAVGLAKVGAGARIDREESRFLFERASLDDLSRLASKVRARFHRPDEATYLIMAIVNYTNVCVAKCDYCSFYRLPGATDAYLLSFEQVAQKVEALR